MAYGGRLLTPTATAVSNEEGKTTWVWRDSSLYKMRRNVEEAKQLPAKHMIMQEDIDPKSLPSSDLGHLHGAQKYAQLGADAAHKLLKSALEPWL